MKINCHTNEVKRMFFFNTMIMRICLLRGSKQLGLKTTHYLCAVYLPGVPPNLVWQSEPSSELPSPTAPSLQM